MRLKVLCAPDIEVAEVILFCFHKSKALADDEVAEFVLHHLSRVESIFIVYQRRHTLL